MADAIEQLTDRQRDVLRLHGEGKNPTEIGEALEISSQGVHGHLRRLRQKGLVEDAGPARGPAAKRRGNGRPITADDALEAVRATARAKRDELVGRKDEISVEIEALRTEAQKIDTTVAELDAMVGAA